MDITPGSDDGSVRARHRPPRNTSWLLWSVVAINAVYTVALLLPGDAGGDLVDVVVSEIAQWLPVCVFWSVAAATRFRRWDVILAAAGLTLSAAGDLYYSLAMDDSGYLPSPSLADVGYVLYYPLMLVALVALVRLQSPRILPEVLLESAVAALGAAAVLGVLLAPTFSDAASGSDALGRAIASAYPLFDLVLVALIAGIAASPRLEAGPRWMGLLGGLLVFAAADIVYALLDERGLYVAGTPLDAAWTVGIGLTAWWVDGIRRPQPPRPIDRPQHVLPLPAIAVLAGLGVLLLATRMPVPGFAVVLAAATVLLASVPIMFRQVVLGRRMVGQEKVLRQLEDLGRLKDEVLTTVNHEMRTPLTAVRGYLDLVLEEDFGPIPHSAQVALRKVESSVDRLDDLVGAMGAMAELEHGYSPRAHLPVPAEALLRGASDALRPLAAGAGVRFEVDGTLPPGCAFTGDSEMLTRAFTALLDNAVKFTAPDGSVRLVLASRYGGGGMLEARISVIDTGMGIPADDLAGVFTRFYRASNAQEAAVRGAGLGLSIARGAIDAHGGSIEIDSIVDVGTRVLVRLPAALAPNVVAPDVEPQVRADAGR